MELPETKPGLSTRTGKATMKDAIFSQLLDHAARSFPMEACGLILRTDYGLVVRECDNKSHEPEQSFLIDPRVYLEHADCIIAVYHSHPNRIAEPSQADIASAERCNLPFVILGYPSETVYLYTPKAVLPAPYVGRRFVYGVMDCLNLVCDYYQHELGINIDDGDRKQWGWWLDPVNQIAFIDGFLANGFTRVTELQMNDLVIMELAAVCPNHVAIYQGDSTILHHPGADTESRIEQYGQYWRQHTVCYLRHE